MTPLLDAGSLPSVAGQLEGGVRFLHSSAPKQRYPIPTHIDDSHLTSRTQYHLTIFNIYALNMASIKGPGAPKTYDGKLPLPF
jgi:hypothetical protein